MPHRCSLQHAFQKMMGTLVVCKGSELTVESCVQERANRRRSIKTKDADMGVQSIFVPPGARIRACNDGSKSAASSVHTPICKIPDASKR